MNKKIGKAKTIEEIRRSEENLKRATSSFLENSLPIFLPVKNIHLTTASKIFQENNGSLKIKTKFGEIEIRGRILGQNHKDILEMLLSQTKKLVPSDDSISVTFGRYAFLQELGRSTGNYKWLEDRIKEIRDFNFAVIYYDKNNQRVEQGGFGIIDQYRFNENGTMSVKFKKEFVEFYRRENLLAYGKYVPLISKIKEPFLKAVIREMLKHKNHKILFSTLVENFSFHQIFGKNEITKFRKILGDKNHQEYLLKNFNISIEKRGSYDFLISIFRDNQIVCLLENKKEAYLSSNEKNLFNLNPPSQ